MTNNIKHLFFDPSISATTLALSTEEAEHCIKTLRLKTGDTIHITDGRGNLYKSIITETTKKQVYIKTLEHHIQASAYSRSLHLAVSPLKNKERFDFIIEKATEIGVAKITVLNCKRTINKTIKTDRLKKKSIAALKQSQQYNLPQIYGPINIKEFARQEEIKQSQILIAHCINTPSKYALDKIILEKNITLMIGPEGDFTQEEIAHALNNHSAHAISLGETRLRTETAAIVASFNILTKK